MFGLVRRLPWLSGKIEAELDKNIRELADKSATEMKGLTLTTSVPDTGRSKEVILDEIGRNLDLSEYKVCQHVTMSTCHYVNSSG